ncbi:hypothetical protein [Shewanella woodyi]|uniref:Uncharacterized protein n=1 Tax=Shewanella woodyi (strain ATCC 51908 / MS32) TaxID=392500 RepID=B1KHP0_SHEWM|nr:hypothetical protein [Shewanella woodyi]ACA86925.1 hypothetical protein Swoo_2648 [Shewanella woodyi ATCC 51908]
MKSLDFAFLCSFIRAKHYAPEENPYRLALKQLNFPLAFFLCFVTWLTLMQLGLMDKVNSYWPQKYVEPSKFNFFSPVTFILIPLWYGVYRFTKTYFLRESKQKEIRAYFKVKSIEQVPKFINVFWFLYLFSSPVVIFSKDPIIIGSVFAIVALMEIFVRYNYGTSEH